MQENTTKYNRKLLCRCSDQEEGQAPPASHPFEKKSVKNMKHKFTRKDCTQSKKTYCCTMAFTKDATKRGGNGRKTQILP
jgi:hypothetical protein